jgi:hypothetical protein
MLLVLRAVIHYDAVVVTREEERKTRLKKT